MGSFDATCVASDIGISCGDEILCFLIMPPKYPTGFGENHWSPLHVPIEGTYDDYGRIALTREEDGAAVMDFLRPRITKLDQGNNPYHEQAVDPATITWDEFQDLDHSSRTFIHFTKDGDVPERETLWGVPDLLTAAGIKLGSKHEEDTVYVHSTANASNLIYVDLPFNYAAQTAMIERVTVAVAPKWNTVVVPAEGSSPDGESPPRGLLIVPAMGQKMMTYFGRDRTPHDLRLTRAFIRKDVYDYLTPVTDEMREIAGWLRDAAEKHHKLDDKDRFMKSAYMFARDMHSLREPRVWDKLNGVYFHGGEGGDLVKMMFAKQILAIPVGSEVEAYLPFVRLSVFLGKIKDSLRRGLRPTVGLTGSQWTGDDWPDQKKFHQACSKIITAARKRKDW